MRNVVDVSEWKTTLLKLEAQINQGDGDSIRARWESGRRLLWLKKGRQLGKGVLEQLVFDFKVHRSELTARMKFAQKFPTAEQVTEVIATYRTWFGIKQQALTDKPRGPRKQPTKSPLARIYVLIQEIDGASLTPEDETLLEAIQSGLNRLSRALDYLHAEREDRERHDPSDVTPFHVMQGIQANA